MNATRISSRLMRASRAANEIPACNSRYDLSSSQHLRAQFPTHNNSRLAAMRFVYSAVLFIGLLYYTVSQKQQRDTKLFP